MEKWRRLNGDLIDIPIEEKVEEIILREIALGHKLKVCIGTDSRVKSKETEYATVIVFLRKKKGGFMLIKNSITYNEISVKERMILEVYKSVDIAYNICDILDRYEVDLEVHADINTDPNFKSEKALKDAMGYIMGMGFVFKAKPDAFASSSCADKIVN